MRNNKKSYHNKTALNCAFRLLNKAPLKNDTFHLIFINWLSLIIERILNGYNGKILLQHDDLDY